MRPGQWVGNVTSGSRGRIVVDLDTNSKGTACTGFIQIHWIGTDFITAIKLDVYEVEFLKEYEVDLMLYDQVRGVALEEGVPPYRADLGISGKATLKFEDKGEKECLLTLESGAKLNLKEVLRLSNVDGKRKLHAREMSWSAFKVLISDMTYGQTVYRGQSKGYPLQTSFHRTKRKCLQRYVDIDMPMLHRQLCGVLDYGFRMEVPDERGALLTLAQHHGFPTPLLDWTNSVYVAAYFAYEKERRNGDETKPVRIFGLNRSGLEHVMDHKALVFVRPHVSILDALALRNPRLIPQQGLSTISNVHDIENFLVEFGESIGKTLLVAYDLPYSERQSVLEELRMMGITRASLFPGIDGVCSELKDRLFR